MWEKRDCLYLHLTLVPYLKAADELKTKPTQHSVGQLREIGIQPDILVCRCEHSISQEDKEKIALFCNVSTEAVIEEKDKDFSIYEVPLSLVDNKIDELIVDTLGLSNASTELDITPWTNLIHRLRNPRHEISIAVVGKYAEHKDAYKSIYESIDHAGIANEAQIRIRHASRVLTSNEKGLKNYLVDIKVYSYPEVSEIEVLKARLSPLSMQGNAAFPSLVSA